MVYLMDKLTGILNIILFIMVIFIVIGGGCFLYYTKIKKQKRLKEDEVDYSHLSREDSADWIKLDDIKDGMIIVDNGQRFIGAIRCQNTADFYSAQEAEQAATAQGFLSFISTIDKPISYRQYCQAVDMEDTINRYKEAKEQNEKKLYNLLEDKKELIANMEKYKTTMSREDVELCDKELEEMEHQIDAYRFRIFHVEDQIRFMKAISGNSVMPQQVQTWIFDWTFNPLDFSVELSEEEIYNRAIRELDSIARAKIHALSNCGVRAYRCTTEELIEMTRRYSCPVSADRFKLRNIVDSSFFDDINISDDVSEMTKKASAVSAENISELSDTSLFGTVPPEMPQNVKKNDVRKKTVKRKEVKKRQREKEKTDSLEFVEN